MTTNLQGSCTKAVLDMKTRFVFSEQFALTPTGREKGGISLCCEAEVKLYLPDRGCRREVCPSDLCIICSGEDTATLLPPSETPLLHFQPHILI